MDQIPDKSQQKTSTEEDVNQKLFYWFEKRGLLLELRAHMLQQLIRTLQDNVTGLNSSKRKTSSSPKFQAMYLLIADFLFHQEHHYTVSVFSMEVPMLSSLPYVSTYVTEIMEASKEGALPLTTPAPRFSAVDIQDILETLGLPAHTTAGGHAAELYDEGAEALLTCIVRALSVHLGVTNSQLNVSSGNNQLTSKHLRDSDNETVEEDVDHWTYEMREILLQSDVKIRHINKLQEKMKKYQENELLRVQEEEASKYEALRAQDEHRIREEIKQEYSEHERALEEQRDKLQQLASHIHEEHEEVAEKLHQLQIQANEVENKKKQQEEESLTLKQMKQDLDDQRKHMEESLARLALDQDKLRREKEELKSYQIKSVDEESSFQQQCNILKQQLTQMKKQMEKHTTCMQTQTCAQLATDKEQQTAASAEPESELLYQLKRERETLSQLQDENVELRTNILQQSCRIDELTHRASTLSTQLEEAQRSLAEHQNQERSIVRSSSPVLPPILSRTLAPLGHWRFPRTGAGEESFFTPRQTPQPRTVIQDARRRPLRFNYNNSQSSEDSSPTNEIINGARQRLQNLEEMQAEINRSYREYQARQQESNTLVHNRFRQTHMPLQNLNRTFPRTRPRFRIQDISSDDSDDESYTNLTRRLPYSRLTGNRTTPPDIAYRKLHFTTFKHYSKYANLKKKYKKHENSSNEEEAHSSNQTPTPGNQICAMGSSMTSSVSDSSVSRQDVKQPQIRSVANKTASPKSFSVCFENVDSLKKVNGSKNILTNTMNFMRRNFNRKIVRSQFKNQNALVLRNSTENHNLTNDQCDSSVNKTQDLHDAKLPENVPPNVNISQSEYFFDASDNTNNIEENETDVTNQSNINDNNSGNMHVQTPSKSTSREGIDKQSNDVELIVDADCRNEECHSEVLALTVPNVNLFNEEIQRSMNDSNYPNVPQSAAIILSVISDRDSYKEKSDTSKSSERSDVISIPREDYSKRSSDFWE